MTSNPLGPIARENFYRATLFGLVVLCEVSLYLLASLRGIDRHAITLGMALFAAAAMGLPTLISRRSQAAKDRFLIAAPGLLILLGFSLVPTLAVSAGSFQFIAPELPVESMTAKVCGTDSECVASIGSRVTAIETEVVGPKASAIPSVRAEPFPSFGGAVVDVAPHGDLVDVMFVTPRFSVRQPWVFVQPRGNHRWYPAGPPLHLGGEYWWTRAVVGLNAEYGLMLLLLNEEAQMQLEDYIRQRTLDGRWETGFTKPPEGAILISSHIMYQGDSYECSHESLIGQVMEWQLARLGITACSDPK